MRRAAEALEKKTARAAGAAGVRGAHLPLPEAAAATRPRDHPPHAPIGHPQLHHAPVPLSRRALLPTARSHVHIAPLVAISDLLMMLGSGMKRKLPNPSRFAARVLLCCLAACLQARCCDPSFYARLLFTGMTANFMSLFFWKELGAAT